MRLHVWEGRDPTKRLRSEARRASGAEEVRKDGDAIRVPAAGARGSGGASPLAIGEAVRTPLRFPQLHDAL